MPLLPESQGAAGGGRLQPFVPFLDLPVPERANLSIPTVRALSEGELAPLVRRAGAGKETAWCSADLASREASLRVLHRHASSFPPSERPGGAELLANLHASLAASAPHSTTPNSRRTALPLSALKRGDLCRACVAQIAIPQVGSKRVKISEVSARGARMARDRI